MKAVVIYDSDCGICTRFKQAVETLDWFRALRWLPMISEEAASYGIPREALEQSVYLVTSRGVANQYPAVRQMLLRLPMTYVLAGLAIRQSPWATLPLALLLSPLSNRLGNAAYLLVARNRYRLSRSTCGTSSAIIEGK